MGGEEGSNRILDKNYTVTGTHIRELQHTERMCAPDLGPWDTVPSNIPLQTVQHTHTHSGCIQCDANQAKT